VLDTLAEIQERHRAVKELEQSLLELHQIFLDMAVLVEAQVSMQLRTKVCFFRKLIMKVQPRHTQKSHALVKALCVS